jgi:hypothetical protein
MVVSCCRARARSSQVDQAETLGEEQVLAVGVHLTGAAEVVLDALGFDR